MSSEYHFHPNPIIVADHISLQISTVPIRGINISI